MNELLEQAETLQNLLVAQATGGAESNSDYRQLRQVFISDPELESLLPRSVRTTRNLQQFWEFIKRKFGSYHERRPYLWDEFGPLLEHLERGNSHPSDSAVSSTLHSFDSAHIHAAWSKALDRRRIDPEGAITMARTLIESVCKHILDEYGAKYDDTADLPKLYRTTAKNLNLAPSQHTEQVFKQILGGCTSIVEGLACLRNRLSDAHGMGSKPVKPAPRHAELAVNLSGAIAQYLIATHVIRNEAET